MTVYAWDASHYDGPITTATLAQARAAGIVAFTHKIGEGTGGLDPLAGTVLAAARNAGIPLIGGYHVVRSGPASPQVDGLLALADANEAWWRTFPGWFWQVDLERWPYDQVPAATGIAFGQELCARTGRVVVLYASHGQYGDQLAAWDGPLWNAHYVTGSGDFRTLYPGDGWVPGWSAYSGHTPDLLQYSSSATIAGHSPADASAYRGTLEQLTALLTPTAPTHPGGDMSILVRVQDGPQAGAIWCTNGVTRRHVNTMPEVAELQASGVLVTSAVRAISAALLDTYGVDVDTLTPTAAAVAPPVDVTALVAALAASSLPATIAAATVTDVLAALNRAAAAGAPTTLT